MTGSPRIQIIGIGDDGLDGLTRAARDLIQQADLLIGAPPFLSAVEPMAAGKQVHAFTGDLAGLVELLQQRGQRQVAILAPGDPLFYGTARYLCDRLGKDEFEVLPHVSSMQLAFARVKESWDEAYLTNLAAQSLATAVERMRTVDRVGVFTTEQQTPADVAQALLQAHIDYFDAYVCENLGGRDERVTRGELSEIAEMEFAPLNVMILVRRPESPDRAAQFGKPRLFGNPDDAFLQSTPKRGLLTPAEVRCVGLAELRLCRTSVVWDVGAGSGSVAVEAARIAEQGTVYAIEMDPEDHQLILANAQRFEVSNLHAILGAAPDAWRDLPDPDAVFIGGTGRKVRGIVELAFARVRKGGALVANVASLDNVSEVHQLLTQLAGAARMLMISVSRGAPFADRLMLEASKPTFLVAAEKPS